MKLTQWLIYLFFPQTTKIQHVRLPGSIPFLMIFKCRIQEMFDNILVWQQCSFDEVTQAAYRQIKWGEISSDHQQQRLMSAQPWSKAKQIQPRVITAIMKCRRQHDFRLQSTDLTFLPLQTCDFITQYRKIKHQYKTHLSLNCKLQEMWRCIRSPDKSDKPGSRSTFERNQFTRDPGWRCSLVRRQRPLICHCSLHK